VFQCLRASGAIDRVPPPFQIQCDLHLRLGRLLGPRPACRYCYEAMTPATAAVVDAGFVYVSCTHCQMPLMVLDVLTDSECSLSWPRTRITSGVWIHVASTYMQATLKYIIDLAYVLCSEPIVYAEPRSTSPAAVVAETPACQGRAKLCGSVCPQPQCLWVLIYRSASQLTHTASCQFLRSTALTNPRQAHARLNLSACMMVITYHW
jgi:hypothetical protein